MFFQFVKEEEQYKSAIKFLSNQSKLMNISTKAEDVVLWVKDNLKLPKRSTAYAAGYDFMLPVDALIPRGNRIIVPTFIKIKLDKDKLLEIFPRSSYGIRKGIAFPHSACVIDSDYFENQENDGHIFLCFHNVSDSPIYLDKGDRCAQGIIKKFYLVEGDEYGNGDIRKGGIGSSWK